MAPTLRVLCLGNELLADDAFGCLVARELRRELPPGLDLVETSAAGLALIDYLQNVPCLLVIDSVQTSTAATGTIFLLREHDIKSVSGASPHYVGLFETLALARKLLPSIPEEVIIFGVEVADCTQVGGPIHPAVQAAVAVAVELVRELTWTSGAAPALGHGEWVARAFEAVVTRFGRERFGSLEAWPAAEPAHRA